MRTLIVSEFVTLDGVMEAPGGEPSHPLSGWVIDYSVAEQEQYKLQEVLEAETLLIGRVTYESFADRVAHLRRRVRRQDEQHAQDRRVQDAARIRTGATRRS